ncbi:MULTISPECIES: response regulator [Sphingosinicellaceae]|uniref:response regulator n=1 Tax=Sphingosinicellaceae TaxID=2820280 RepID=UPI001C1E8A15|nr:MULTISPECIES: response regulator [Polymorphobacter]QYE36260.1 response regulator [Polymorphobacter sp. PAMC 29334]UAJ10167.1 response regulator [Polymorphobacter megasporae]
MENIVPNATTILVVDDEALIADMVCDALTDSGFEVVVANDGGEALSMIAMNPHIHALVTDINMGAGADGWHVARCAREACPCIPVVYTTGGAAHEWVRHGVNGSILVVKPFHVDRIVSALNQLLNGLPTTH